MSKCRITVHIEHQEAFAGSVFYSSSAGRTGFVVECKHAAITLSKACPLLGDLFKIQRITSSITLLAKILMKFN